MREPQRPKIWHFDPANSPTERQKALNKGQLYQLLEATEVDEQKAVEFYNHCPVPGLEVGEVQVIYNKTFNIKFNEHLKTLQQRAGKEAFAPKWKSMSNPDLREKTYKLFLEKSKPYTDPDYPDVKFTPAWHGTKQERLDSIFQIGYSNLAIIDSGYFGKGLYSTYEAKYAYEVYVQNQTPGALILNWVAIFSPLPVINNGTYKPSMPATADKPKKPERFGDMCILMGKGNYGNYDAHFVPVAPSPYNSNGTDFFPCGTGQEPMYTEIVVFESAACLPRYLVKLRPIPSPQTRLIEQRTKEERRQLLIAQQLKEQQLKREQELEKQQIKEQRREDRKLMEQQLKDQHEKIQHQEQKIAGLTQELFQKENEIKTKIADIDALKSEYTDLKSSIVQQKSSNDKLIDKYDQKFGELTQLVVAKKQELQDKDQLIARKDRKIQSQQQIISDQNQQLTKKDREISEKEAENKILKSNVNKLEKPAFTSNTQHNSSSYWKQPSYTPTRSYTSEKKDDLSYKRDNGPYGGRAGMGAWW